MKAKRWEINLETVAKALCNIITPLSGQGASRKQNYPQLYVAGTHVHTYSAISFFVEILVRVYKYLNETAVKA